MGLPTLFEIEEIVKLEEDMYSFESRIRYSEADSKGAVKMSAILDYFQDCSSFQAEEAGVGLQYMARNQVAWVLTCWQVELKRRPSFGEKITVSTWPYGFKSFFGYRNYTMKGEQEELLACANSVWVLLDLKSKKPVRVPQEMADAYKFFPRLQMEETSRKVALPEGMEQKEPFRVHKYHIDTNQHVNNGKYISMAQEYLPGGFETGKLKAEYRKAAVYGDMIYPYAVWQEDKITVSLADEQGSPYAVVELEERK